MTKKKGTIYVGIDPGWDGGIAAIFPDGVLQTWHTHEFVRNVRHKHPRAKTESGKPKVSVERFYIFRKMYLLLRRFKKLEEKGHRVIVAIEAQRGRETDSKKTVLSVGRNQGLWEALAGANDLETQLIYPHAWKPRYTETGADKSRSVEVCINIYPSSQAEFSLKKDEARAEALLIADYAKRREECLAFPRNPSRRRKGVGKKKKARRKRRSRAIPR